jgi:hypothetical protein
MLRVLITTAVVLAIPLTSIAGKDDDQGRYQINVLTMGQGDELFARFGHIALMVDDKQTRTRKCYNFGTFDFADPSLRVRYARGFLIYWLSVGSYAEMVRRYRYMNREVTLRTLDLTAEQAAEVARRLDVNARPENREYAYRHYLDNCCTRIRDLLDDVLGGAISSGRDEQPTERTYRYWTDRALHGLPVMQAMILFSLGPAIDRPITRWDEQFLPEVLGEDLDATRIGPDDRPLVKKKRVVVKRRGAAVGIEMPTWELGTAIGVIAALVLFLGLPLLLGRRRIGARLAGAGIFFWGLLCGLGGLMLVLYWTVTAHTDTHYNENLLVWPVLHLWLIGPGLKLLFKARLGERTARFLGRYLIVALALILIDIALKVGPFIQGNWGPILWAALCNAAALAGLWRTGILPKLLKASETK